MIYNYNDSSDIHIHKYRYIIFIFQFIILFLSYAYINEGCIYVVIRRLTEWLQYNTIIIIYIKEMYVARENLSSYAYVHASTYFCMYEA